MDQEDLLEKAANPESPPALLRVLARNVKSAQRVATNPNTPLDLLFQLGEIFPQEFLENPIFPLLLLENPNFLNDLPMPTLKALLGLRTLPTIILEWAAKSYQQDVKKLVAKHPATPQEIIEKFTKDVSLWRELAQNPSSPPEFLERLVAPRVIIGPVESLWRVRLLVAENPNASTKTLDSLANDPIWAIRRAVAKHPNASSEALDLLSKEKIIEGIRQEVAKHPATSETTLLRLALDPDWTVRLEVAHHPRLPKEQLVAFIKDPDPLVKRIAKKRLSEDYE